MQIQPKSVPHFCKLLFLTVFLFVITSFFLVGCNDSGDDDNDTGGSQTVNNVLDGNYRFYLIADNAGDVWNQLNATTFDGAGGFTLNTVYDSDGGGTTLSGTYAVNSEGELTVENTDLRGQVATDGSFFATTDANSSDSDGDISLAVTLKGGSGMNNSVLNGDYILCQIRNDASSTAAARMAFTFDGDGNFSGDVLADSNDSDGSLAGTYAVDSDGALGIVVTGLSKTFTGNASADGRVLVLIDTDDDGEVLMMVGVKASSGMDVTRFSGDYQLHLINNSTSGTFTSRIDLTADGAGTLSSEIMAASDGDTSEQPNMAYTVTSDGALAITGTDIIGQLSSNGEIFVMGDADASIDGEVSLMIGIKKM